MLAVFRFLLLLVAERFWGEVTLRFKDGQVSGQIDVRRGYVADTLPQPQPGTPTASAVATMEDQMRTVLANAARGRTPRSQALDEPIT